MRQQRDSEFKAIEGLRQGMPRMPRPECINDDPCPTPSECWEAMACHKAMSLALGLPHSLHDPKTDTGRRNLAPPLVQHRGPPAKPKAPPLGDKMVILPAHYARFAIEPAYFSVTNKLDGLEFNIIKYVCRAPYKHPDFGKQDYTKAIRSIIMKAKELRGDPDWAKPYKNPDLQRIIEEELSYAPET